MLLRNVLAAFLDNLPNERALDLPFLALLADMGFEDVHFTHGAMEFGKDFIAKRREGGQLIQYAFQSKAGNLSQGGWREVMPQMLEAVISGLSHPAFDKTAPQKVVLVVSGRLSGNASLGLQDFNAKLVSDYQKPPIDLWDRERLIEYFLQHGPDSFYAADAQGVQAFGTFLTCYGDALRGTVTVHEIERHSRAWMSPDRMFEGALEAELLGAACARTGRPYEGLVCLLAYVRSALAALHSAASSSRTLQSLHAAAITRLAQLADEYVVVVEAARTGNESGLFAAMAGASIVSYPIECSRALEVAALSCLIGNDEQRARGGACLHKMAEEPGAAHPVSDQSAVALVLAVLALVACGRQDDARALVRKAAVWVADRYEEGAGLAEFDAPAVREVEFLLGHPFEGVGVEPRTSSLLATALCDLAAFLGDDVFFADVVNEFSAVDIAFQYFQPSDTAGQFRIDGTDVIQYPNVEYSETAGAFADFTFGNHVTSEPRQFRLAETAGVGSYGALMLLLRDRYFPSLWPALAASRAVGPGSPTAGAPHA